MEEKVFFVPGDVVVVRQFDNSPKMLVLRKKELIFKDGEDKTKTLQGIVCRWFTNDGLLQEAVWNTKDLIKI